MTRRDASMIAALSLIWGASFMFIRVADRELDPVALVWLRLLLACTVLVPAAFMVEGRDALTQARGAWKLIVVLGLINTAIPFLLISWSETRIDSGLAAILQAAVPIFTAMLAVRFGAERVTGWRLVGVLVGMVGVALLIGSPGAGAGLLAPLAVVVAALAYASGATFASHMLVGLRPLVVAAGSTVAATLLVTPFGVATLPGSVPGWKTWGSVVVLGLLGTGVAYIILFALIQSVGPSRTVLITYLIPGVALAYGIALLGEPARAISFVGLALILVGVALAGRRPPAVAREPVPAPVCVSPLEQSS
jgi:drug/metabolite transporter (DMT)-like permease